MHRNTVIPLIVVALLVSSVTALLFETQSLERDSYNDLLLVGRVEWVHLLAPVNLRIKSKIDSGAFYTSLNALDIEEFIRAGESWVRFYIIHPQTNEKMLIEKPLVGKVVIKQLARKSQVRNVINMTLKLGSIEESVEVTLTDRTGYLYQLLIGRNLLAGNTLIDTDTAFLTGL
jgi:hypothetical protein